MLSAPVIRRPRLPAGATALVLSVLVLLGVGGPVTGVAGAAPTPATAPSSSLSAPRPVAAAAITRPRGAVPVAALPKGWCGKRVWSTRYMRISTAKALVTWFTRAIRAGKGAAAALGAGAAATGIGAPAGFALTALGWVAGDFIIDLVEKRLVAHFDHFRQIRFQLHIGCKGPFLYPKLRLGGKLKR